MMNLSDRARRRLELAASELPMSAQSYFLRRDAINWGIVAIMLLLLITSILISISIASGRGDLEDEVEQIKLKWAYEQGRADQEQRQREEWQIRAQENAASVDRLSKIQERLIDQVLVLRAIEQHVEAGGGDEQTKEFIAELRRRRAEAQGE